ncbi:IS630 family transposase [Hymenobacter nivis]|uniref:IS630 family transposase n=1 Tax=Hymenobacter nivis TaxID=1850093 RepID=A0A2Z3GS08_9BACT|nr:IS630 family transposase [Hymenobacter nivis]AWM33186.1 IS630 family transposase [Hymenobacter nivis]
MRQVQELEQAGALDLFYGDESGFCLTSAIPYGWQFPGEHVATQPRHSQRFNVLGLFNATTNELHTAAREGSVDAAFVIDTLDAWVATRTRPTVLVLDNARLHHTAAFQARLQDWEDRDVHIFYLPTYSPHLNKIETLWRKVKYEWLRPEAYADFKTLKTAVWHILDRVGRQFTIQFAT